MAARTRVRRATVIGTAVVALVALAGCLPAVGRVAVKQPANSPRVFDASDPAVLVAGGKTWLFGSTNNMKLPVRQITAYSEPVATSQAKWASGAKDAMPTRPAWVDPAEWQIWAPSAIQIGSKYVMYFAARRGGVTYDENNDQCIGRAVATSVTGPYTPGASPVYCGLPAEGAVGGMPRSNPWGRGALDPEVFKSTSGRLYLLVSLSRTRDNIGVIGLDAAGNPTGGVNAAPKILVGQSLPWHDGTIDSTMRSDAFLENPSMVYDSATKTYLLFYSAGQWYTSRYVTGFARCETITGPCAVDSRGPFLMAGSGRTGVGGLTAFRGTDGKLRVAYASWQSGHENQAGPGGIYSRQVHWAALSVSATSDPAGQVISLK